MKDFKIYLSIAGALLLVYLVAQYNKPSPVNWSPTLYYKDKIPFGTYIVYHQLNQLFRQAKVVKTNASIYNVLKNSGVRANYLVFAGDLRINKTDYGRMVKYISAGNSVFISSFDFNSILADTLNISTSYESSRGNTRLNFTSPQLKQPADYVFNHDISNQYFSDFDTTKATVIGQNNNGHSTFLSFKFGKGYLYLCANPGVFTNYSLLSKGGADYAAKALSYLPAASKVYWDEYQNGDIPEDESLFRVFFTSPALQWAYYLSFAGALIFILFEIKRRQRVIPVLAPLPNSTVEFVTVVGQVYYEKRDNANIIQKKILYFLEHLRESFLLKTNKLDEEFVERLIAKTGITTDFAIELVNAINQYAPMGHITDKELIYLNHLIEQFYIKSR